MHDQSTSAVGTFAGLTEFLKHKLRSIDSIDVVVFLFLIRVVLSFVGIGRMPLMPLLGDEVIINDPAVSLATGGGFVARSFAHSGLFLDQIYGHFPPLYILMQGANLKLFGVTAQSLRAPSAIYGNAAILMVILIGRHLRKVGTLDRVGFLCLSLPLLLEPGFFALSRWARMDSLVAMLSTSSLYFLFLYETQKNPKRILLFIASILMGASLATHFEAVVFFLPFCAYCVFLVRRTRAAYPAAAIAVALSVPAIACLVVWRGEALLAIHQMREITAEAPGPGLHLGQLATDVASGNLRGVWLSGGIGLLLTLLAPIVFLARAILGRRTGPLGASHRNMFWFLGATAIILPFVFEFALPSSTTRFIVVEPLCLLTIGVSVSGSSAAWRRIAALALVGFVALEIAGLGAYVSAGTTSWAKRSPDRFDALLAAYPANATIVGDANLWYALSRRSAKHAILYPFIDERRQWHAHPAYFGDYDLVILQDGDDLASAAAESHPRRAFYSDGWNEYVILSR